jgi:hypothetical protein
MKTEFVIDTVDVQKVVTKFPNVEIGKIYPSTEGKHRRFGGKSATLAEAQKVTVKGHYSRSQLKKMFGHYVRAVVKLYYVTALEDSYATNACGIYDCECCAAMYGEVKIGFANKKTDTAYFSVMDEKYCPKKGQKLEVYKDEDGEYHQNY